MGRTKRLLMVNRLEIYLRLDAATRHGFHAFVISIYRDKSSVLIVVSWIKVEIWFALETMKPYDSSMKRDKMSSAHVQYQILIPIQFRRVS